MGRLGAYLSNWYMYYLFGLPSYLVVYFIWRLGLNFLRRDRLLLVLVGTVMVTNFLDAAKSGVEKVKGSASDAASDAADAAADAADAAADAAGDAADAASDAADAAADAADDATDS